MSGRENTLTRSLDDLVSSLSRQQEEQEWNSFDEDQMLATDTGAAVGQTGESAMSRWAADASPPSFLGSLAQATNKPEGGEVMQEMSAGGFDFGEGRSPDRDAAYMQSIEEANHWSLYQYQSSLTESDASAARPSHDSAAALMAQQSAAQQQQAIGTSQQQLSNQELPSPSNNDAQQNPWGTSSAAAISALQSQQQFMASSKSAPSFSPSLASRLTPQAMLQQPHQQLQQNATAAGALGGLASQLMNPLPLTPSQQDQESSETFDYALESLRLMQAAQGTPQNEALLQLHPQIRRLHLQRLQQQVLLRQQMQQLREGTLPAAITAQLQLQQIQQQRQFVQNQLQQLHQLQQQAPTYHQQLEIGRAQMQHQNQLNQLQHRQAQIHAQLRAQQQQHQARTAQQYSR